MSADSPCRAIPFVVAAPSGTGKTTVCRAVVDRDPNIVFSVSHTTRERRGTEVDGHDYHFVTETEFRELAEQGAFLEWAEYNQHLYGTSIAALDACLGRGRDVLLEIEVQGAKQIRARREDARFLFLLPPSFDALRERLRGRKTESEEQIERRLELAHRELAAAGLFDYAIPNDDLEVCVARVLEILRAERAGGDESLRVELAPAKAVARLRAEEARGPGAR